MTTRPHLFDLPAMPDVLPSFARAVLSMLRRADGHAVIPDWAERLTRVRFDARHLAEYNALCGFARRDAVPMTYPQALATPLFLHLMTRPGFPLPLLGLVHVRNAVEQRRALSLDDSLDLQVRLAGSREVRSGLEIELSIELAETGSDDVLWRATMTVLRRAAKSASGRATPPAAPAPPLAQYLTIVAPADIGRRYARVSRDYNPIHLYAATARLFGFPQAIAHGLWSAARTLALLEGRLGVTPQNYQVQFRQPLLLPGRAALRFVEAQDGIDFALLGEHGGRVHLTGTLR